MANAETRPDDLILETAQDVVRGRAKVADLRAAIELCLALPGWEKLQRERAVNEHLLTCDNCMRHTLRDLKLRAVVESMFGPDVDVQVVELNIGPPDLAHAPTKGVH